MRLTYPKMYSIWAYDATPDLLVVKGFFPSAIAASRLRRLHLSNVLNICLGGQILRTFEKCKPTVYTQQDITHAIRNYMHIYASASGTCIA